MLREDPPPTWKADVLQESAAALNAVHWQPRGEWSPTREWETRERNRPSALSMRWRYASHAWRDVLVDWQDRLALRAEFTPRDLNEQDMLAELAQADNLAGWNAAILLAQQNPQRAKAFEPILYRLATQPPRYVLSQVPLEPETESLSLLQKAAKLWRKPSASPPRESQQISLAMQAAAAEAWCLVLSNQKTDQIEAMAPAGRALLEFDLPEEVRGELFRGIARRVPPANVPGLDHALPQQRGSRPNSPTLRQAAVDACVLYALWNREALTAAEAETGKQAFPWPATLLDWQWEPDAYFETDSVVRRRFAYWLVLTRHPNAAKVLESHLTDREFSVRDDALVHLGWLKTPEAMKTLQKHARRPEPRVRAMAVKGLAHWGVPTLVPFLGDDSHEVRLSVAEELGRFPTLEAARELQNLQADPSREVEKAALASTRSWPDGLAIPMLLHGMEHASLQTRRECFRELRRRTELKATFPIAAGPEVRREAVKRLIRDWNLPANLELPEVAPKADAKVNRLRVEELRLYLMDVINPEFSQNSARHQLALKALKESAAEDVPAIETFLLEQPATPEREVILHNVLPALSPAHAALRKMQSAEVRQRRIAADELYAIAERQSLSPLAVHELGQILEAENDGLVWRSALHAILPDDNAETAQIIAWAANHPDAGIRQLACEFATRHKRPEFANWLLPLIRDPQQTVQLPAIEAAGWCGNRIVIEGLPAANEKESLPGLRALLTDPDSRVSLAAAIAMSRLGDPLGHDELIRLSHHSDDRIRLQVIAAMGDSRQTRFVETLIGMGWTARNDLVKREVLNSLDQLVPREKHPPALAKATETDDKIKVWAEWGNPNQNRP